MTASSQVMHPVLDRFREEVQRADHATATLQRLFCLWDGDVDRTATLERWKRFAPEFREDALDAFATAVIVYLSRLADPAMTGSMQNFSLDYVVEACGIDGTHRLDRDILDRIQDYKTRVAAIRVRRNKIEAHLDRQIACSGDCSSLDRVTVDDTLKAVKLLDAIADLISLRLTNSNLYRVSHADLGVRQLEAALEGAANWHRLRVEAQSLGAEAVFQIVRRGEFPQEQSA